MGNIAAASTMRLHPPEVVFLREIGGLVRRPGKMFGPTNASGRVVADERQSIAKAHERNAMLLPIRLAILGLQKHGVDQE